MKHDYDPFFDEAMALKVKFASVLGGEAQVVHRNGGCFIAHPKFRFDPVFTPLAVGTMVAGTAMSVVGSIQQGKQAEQIGKARADIDRQNAKFALEAATEKARILGERGRRLGAANKAAQAAGGTMINAGTSLVIEAENEANIAKDVGFTMMQGENAYWSGMSSAAIEEAQGKAMKKQSLWDAMATGMQGMGSIAFLGYQGGLWGKAGSKAAGTAGGGINKGNIGGEWVWGR